MKTWKERIMDATGERNARGVYLWYSHDKILDAIDRLEGINTRAIYRSLTCYLQDLVKGGFLIRAVKPPHMSRKVRPDGKPEYLYRQSGKLYKRIYSDMRTYKNAHSDAHVKSLQAHELWRMHKRLPKWYRRMMMD